MIQISVILIIDHKMMADERLRAISNTFDYINVYGGYIYCGWNELRKQDGKDKPTVFACNSGKLP